MNREIKFRGKSIFKNDWWEGFYIYSEYEKKHFIVQNAIDNQSPNGSISFAHFAEIDEKTLGQFTGLQDKNGKDIYEGDVLAISNRKDWDKNNFVGYEIFYHDNDSCEYNVGFQMNRFHYFGNICGTSDFKKFKPQTVKNMEIIGNVFENPYWKHF